MDRRNVYGFLTIISVLLSNANALEEGERCQTPDRAAGSCIGVRDCAPLSAALQVKPLPQSTVDFLRRSQCGFKGRNPLVCCPSSTAPVTPTTPSTNVSPAVEEDTEDISQHPNLRLLRTDICGPIADDRIINGNLTKINELPWMSLIAYTVRTGSPFKCGGTVISDRYILTAAHCVKFLPSNLRPTSVRLGEHDLDADIDCEDDPEGERICAPAPQDIRIEEIVSHPNYRGKPDLQNDIAIIRLSSAADFTPDSVRPICLPIGISQQTQDLVAKKVIVSGWGVTENGTASRVLLKVAVPVMTRDQCASAFRGSVPISGRKQLCAGGVKNGGDSCSGDSGGPLTFYGNIQGSARTIQHGVVSYGPRLCGSTGQPGVYTRIGHYMKWVLDNMKP